jgi:NAD(P)-dependent dehydrogenase (short-subunit alcohol dehydrogenase family)
VLETQVADFSDNAVIKGFIPALYERHSTIYGLVNNAGLYHGKSVYAYSDDEVDEILNVNLKALVYLSSASLSAAITKYPCSIAFINVARPIPLAAPVIINFFIQPSLLAKFVHARVKRPMVFVHRL